MNAPAQKPKAVPSPPPASKMTLKSITKGRRIEPLKVVMYGTEGIGKSSFGAGAPAPIFLGAEDGTGHLDVSRFPTPETWTDVLEAVRTLTDDEHTFQTLVCDTLDWMEPLLWDHICKRDKQESIEAYGYGKGYQAALDEWRVFLAALERLRKTKGMHVVLLAHSWIKKFQNPESEDFDRYELKLNAKAAGLIKEWSDCVLFANYETFATKDGKTKRVRGVDTGARLIHTQRRAAYDAKNRHSLPETIPLSWPDFQGAVEAQRPADPALLESEIRRKIEGIGEADRNRALEAIKRAGGDAVKLSQLNDWSNAKLAEASAKEE